MSEFLDRLAMEVAEWGNGFTKDPMRWEAICDEVVENGMLKKSPVGRLAFNDDGDRAAVHQWLQRRKELINEPDDADAPEWAEWKAQDSDGSWHWYKGDRPRAIEAQWYTACGGGVSAANKGKIPAGHVWRTTLKEVKRETKVELEETVDPIESEIIRAIAMIRVETDEDVRFSLVGHLDALLGAVRNKLLDSAGWESTNLTQRKIQSLIDSGEYREMKGVTVLVSEEGRAAIVSKGGAFYWVDSDSMAREWGLAGEGDD